ncbi:phosphoadenylyl-sulfate reductase [Microbacterium protaetiae]|uniref:phosphoadenylyl-sulfate reductase n=1 Tax=Microbacterium protaetiae TaxID=2509458 RepID=UPI001A92C2EF|nr:phosphoadenylyl-sulfate reductase [Microbacterium protaetiae]
MSTATRTRDAAALQALAVAGRHALGDAPHGVAPDELPGPEATPTQVVAWVAENFPLRSVAVACSMADGALPHLVAQQLPGVDVLFLDTGYHFAETAFTRNEVAERLDVTVVDVRPELTIAQQTAAHGKDLFARDPNLCCAIRKVEPLHRALQGYDVWITGVRRDESPTRTDTPLITWDERNGLVKVNPVAAWSFDDLLDYATVHEVPVNPLVAQGYPSIGCAPCTRPVAAGEDPRAGRWAGLAKTECGLHL